MVLTTRDSYRRRHPARGAFCECIGRLDGWTNTDNRDSGGVVLPGLLRSFALVRINSDDATASEEETSIGDASQGHILRREQRRTLCCVVRRATGAFTNTDKRRTGGGARELREPEREYNFNIKKRSKKHLRNDLRREERERKEKVVLLPGAAAAEGAAHRGGLHKLHNNQLKGSSRGGGDGTHRGTLPSFRRRTPCPR